MFTGVPSEVQILGMYFPPLFVAIVTGLLCAMLVTKLLNQTGLSRFFWQLITESLIRVANIRNGSFIFDYINLF